MRASKPPSATYLLTAILTGFISASMLAQPSSKGFDNDCRLEKRFCICRLYRAAVIARRQGCDTKVIFNFDGTNGSNFQAGLIADSAGNLYGATASGGTSNKGTVFKLAPPAAGQTAWTETVLASFTGANGAAPVGGLIADSAGNLYGTTAGGGASSNCSYGCGTVFKLAPPAAGTAAWTETVLAS